MTPEAILPHHIDSTMISCFRSCPQKFYKEFVLGLRPTALSVDLHAGACLASAIETVRYEVYGKRTALDVALARAHGVFLQEWGDFVPFKDTPKTKENVWEAVMDYFRQYPPLTDHVQPYFLDGEPTMEFTFAIPLEPCSEIEQPGHFPLHPSGQPFFYCGRFDLLGTYNGRPCVVDEKSTKSIASNWSDQWRLRSQFTGYVWGCQNSGIELETVVVRGIGILKTKISHAEAILVRNNFQIDRWYEQLRRDMWKLRRAWDETYFDFNLADSCSSYGGCAFTDLCLSKNEANWYSNYTVRRWNPLLKDPTSNQEVA